MRVPEWVDLNTGGLPDGRLGCVCGIGPEYAVTGLEGRGGIGAGQVGSAALLCGGLKAPLGRIAGDRRLAGLTAGASPLYERHHTRARDPDHEQQHSGHRPAVAGQLLAEHVHRRVIAGEDRQAIERSSQVRRQVRGTLVAPLRVLGEGLGDNGVDVAAIGPVECRQTSGFLVADDAGQFRDRTRSRLVGQSPGEEFVQDHAEGVNVGAGVR